MGVDKHYKQNELGYFNFFDHQRFSSRISYQILNEYGFLRKYSNYLWFNDTRTFHSFDRKLWGLRFGNDFSTQNLMVFEADFAYASKTRDYNKPRTINRYIEEPENFQAKLVMQSIKTKISHIGFNGTILLILKKVLKNRNLKTDLIYLHFIVFQSNYHSH